MNPLSIEALQQKIAESELGREWINDSLISQDVWSLTELGFSKEECKLHVTHNIYFDSFSLPWLKLLAKLTVKAILRERYSIGLILVRLSCLKHLDEFLVRSGYTQPQAINKSLLQQFVTVANSRHRRATITYAASLWAEERWLVVSFTPPRLKKSTPKIETIPEEVLYQVYEKFDLFPSPLERLFRLQLVLGCRIGELLRTPRQCLRQELDMLSHYRKYSLSRLEKEAKAKAYVDMYGRVTSFKPRKRRYERLDELLKVSTPLGECHRPAMLGDCQYRYACLSCDHHRVTLEDKPKLEADIKHLQQDLEQAQVVGQERRVTEIDRLLELLKTRLQGLEKLENLKEYKS